MSNNTVYAGYPHTFMCDKKHTVGDLALGKNMGPPTSPHIPYPYALSIWLSSYWQYCHRGRGIVGDFQSKCVGPTLGEGWGVNYGNVD